jgi:hypothetical protein
MKPGSQLKAIVTRKPEPGTIPVEYMTTDRILERWAADSGDGLPTEVWDDTRTSRAVPLPDDVWLVVDGCVRRAPTRTREFIVRWYKSPLPTSEQARKAKMGETQYQKAHLLILHFMKYRLEETRDPTLVRLLSMLG